MGGSETSGHSFSSSLRRMTSDSSNLSPCPSSVLIAHRDVAVPDEVHDSFLTLSMGSLLVLPTWPLQHVRTQLTLIYAINQDLKGTLRPLPTLQISWIAFYD